jgi:hypothetical protein
VSHYQDYKARFDRNRALLQIPEDCVCRAPQYRANDFIDPHSWDFSWFLTFADQHYISCNESWSYRTGRPLQRHYFSFHYGPIARIDANGKIDRDQNNPLIIRIDRPAGVVIPPHLHYLRPHPFPDYKQAQIHGLTLLDTDMFQFVRAVFRSRLEAIEMNVAMGFTYE